MEIAIGLDLGGTKTEAVALGPDGQELARLRHPTPVSQGARAIVHLLVDLRNQVARLASTRLGGAPIRLVTIGLGTPGSLSPVTGRLRNSNTQCLNGIDLAEEVSRAMGQSVVIENDANCFALAEALQGAGRGYAVVFGVILGTGCGGGIVLGQRLHAGRSRLAGEWGHTQSDPYGLACWCGQRGCLETLVSGGGLKQAFLTQTGLSWSAEEILYEPKHAVAIALQTRFYVALAQAIAELTAVLDPDVVVLGGGLSNFPGLIDRIKPLVASRVFGREWQPNIVLHGLGDSAGVIGAAWLGRHAGNTANATEML